MIIRWATLVTVYYYNFGWKDYDHGSLEGLLDAVKVLSFAVNQGKAAVHCHAGMSSSIIMNYKVYVTKNYSFFPCGWECRIGSNWCVALLLSNLQSSMAIRWSHAARTTEATQCRPDIQPNDGDEIVALNFWTCLSSHVFFFPLFKSVCSSRWFRDLNSSL